MKKSISVVAILYLITSCNYIKIEKVLRDSNTLEKPSPFADKNIEDPSVQNNFGGSGAPIPWELESNVLLFQSDYEDSDIDRGGSPSKYGLNNPDTLMVFSDPNDGNKLKLMITEWSNARILIWNKIPESEDDYPDIVVGQPNFNTVGKNSSGVSDSTLNFFNSATVCETGELIIADRLNHRILIYSKVPTENGASANLIFGQDNFSNNLPNRGGAPSANTVNSPQGLSCNDGKLYIADSGNNRILVFNSIPTSNTASADLVFGQPNFTSSTSGVSETAYHSPHSLTFYNNQMFVIDQSNSRILIYDTIPTSNQPVADLVIGQNDFVTTGRNKGAGTSSPCATCLNIPQSISINKSGTLAIADRWNHRIVFYSIPYSQGDSAIAVLGQPDFTTNTIATPNNSNFEQPIGIIYHGSKIWVIDQKRHRFYTLDLPNEI